MSSYRRKILCFIIILTISGCCKMGISYCGNFDTSLDITNDPCGEDTISPEVGVIGSVSTINSKFGAGSIQGPTISLSYKSLSDLPGNSGTLGFWVRSETSNIITVVRLRTAGDSFPGNTGSAINLIVNVIGNKFNIIIQMWDDNNDNVVSGFGSTGIDFNQDWNYVELNWLWKKKRAVTEVSFNSVVVITSGGGENKDRDGGQTDWIEIIANDSVDIFLDDFIIHDTKKHGGNFSIPVVSQCVCQISPDSQVNLSGLPDPYEGDPKIVLTENGASLKFVGGQPVMDQGLENFSLISLLTKKGWVGNFFIRAEPDKIGADFLEIATGTRTLSSLRRMENAAERALQSPLFEDIEVSVSNPQSDFIDIVALVKPPNQDQRKLELSKNSANWNNQAENPANRRI